MQKRTKGYVVYPDSDGVLHNALQISETQPHWMETAEAFLEYFKATKHPNIHSIYLRGSAANGNAIDSFSDIDFYILTHQPIMIHDVIAINEFAAKLNERYSFITKFDIGYYTTNQIFHNKEGALLKITALCIFGTDISDEIPSPRVGEDMMLSISQIEEDIQEVKNEAASGMYDNPEKLRRLCIWISKKLIRSGFEIVAEREQCFTRDILICKDIFIKYYPEKQPEMERAVSLFLKQTDNVADVIALLEDLGMFLVHERKTTRDFSRVV